MSKVKTQVIKAIDGGIKYALDTLEYHNSGEDTVTWDEYIATIKAIRRLETLLNEVQEWQ